MIFELVSLTTGEIVKTFGDSQNEQDEMVLYMINHLVKFSEKTTKENNLAIEKLEKELGLKI